ncbi:MAG: FUSC family protein [Rubrobacteraceae bacterium]|nr:FUSC family protein [Rubrobacteraceae bacterium]
MTNKGGESLVSAEENKAIVLQRLHAGAIRLRSGWLPILQTAVAACLAWFLAVLLLGIERPTFAPIAAVIVLGLAVDERGRRAVELTLGVAFGVTMADLLLSVVGVGALQAGAFVVLAMTVAVFLGGGDLGVKEAGISAMIIMFTFTPSAAGFPIERFLEALIGGGTALLINALLPVNPERMVEDAAFPVFEESAAVLEEVASALENGDAGRAQAAYVKAREIDARVAGLKEAVAAGRETARLAPPRRRSLGHMDLYAAAADQIDLTVRDVRALARAALSVVQPEAEDPVPERLPAAIRGLARASVALAAYLQTSGDPPDETRRLALEAAKEASTLLEEHEDLASNLGVNALVDQIHSSAVDLIGGTGMDRAEALQALQEATGRASW